MSLTSWRQLPFFEGTPIKDPNYGSVDNALYSDSTVSAVCEVGGFMAISTDHCMVKLINKKLDKIFEFQCYELGWSVNKMCSFKTTDEIFLVTIAEKQGLPVCLKLWNLNKIMNPSYNMKKFNFNSSYHTMCNITNGSNNYPLTCFAYSSDYSVLSFGFSNGTVVLLRGDLLHDRGSRQRIIYDDKEPITAIHFRDENVLYVTTVSKVFTLSTKGKNNGIMDKALDDKFGSDINCSLLTSEKTLLVSRDTSFQYYNLKGKLNSIQLDIPKKRAYFYKDRYILFLSYFHSTLTESSIISNNKIIIIDLKNGFVVYNQSISHSIFEIFEIWDDLHILFTDGSLLKLHEKDIKERVSILSSRELFQIAIKLANENMDDFSNMEIMKLRKDYGEYLYDKGEFGDSIEQFVKCIPLGKTSETIAKFKESSKIQFLVTYLEEIISLKLSTPHHINLLLTSYCKLKKLKLFENFIASIEIDEDFEFTNIHEKFDFNSIIEFCKENEYYDLALLIAEKFNLPLTVVEIQLNDMNDPPLTIAYIQSLSIDDLLRVLVDNVEVLLNFLPNETTQLLIDVFTGKYIPRSRKALLPTSETDATKMQQNETHPLLTSYKQFVQFMSSTQKDIESSSSHSGSLLEKTHDSVLQNPTYLPPKPRIIFSSFVNHHYEFVIFLEACVESYDSFGGNPQDKKDIMFTLYEIYLTLSKEDTENKKSWEDKALFLIKDRTGWSEDDKNSLLLISSMYGFSQGEMLIREYSENAGDSLQGFELDIFRAAIFSGDILKSYDILINYGSQEPELYRVALTTYTSSETFFSTIGDIRFGEILDAIDKNQLLTPLEVLEYLNRGNANVKLCHIKKYLLKIIEKQKTEVKNNEKLVSAYTSKLNDLNSQLHDLIEKPKIVNASKCSVCLGRLEFPIVYFKCGHQIHESCLIENNSLMSGKEFRTQLLCPICSADSDALLLVKKEQADISKKQHLFQTSLNGSNDRFKSMFGFLGRGGLEPMKEVLDLRK